MTYDQWQGVAIRGQLQPVVRKASEEVPFDPGLIRELGQSVPHRGEACAKTLGSGTVPGMCGEQERAMVGTGVRAGAGER